MPTVFTVGHSNRSLQDLIVLLRVAGVQMVVDVRRFPGSRRWPWFRQDALKVGLEVEGIHYVWLGETLGGYTRPPYPEYMATPAFRQGLEALEQLARKEAVAILCAERDWRRCHRRFIAQALVARGWQVVHLLDFGVNEVHVPGLPLEGEGPSP